MFKLRKILNAGSNIPEYCLLPVKAGLNYKRGCALILKEGVLCHPEATEAPTHVSVSDFASGEGSELICYKITPDMLFEALRDDDTLLKRGDRFALRAEDGACLYLTRSDEGAAVLYELPDTDEQRKITVRFHM